MDIPKCTKCGKEMKNLGNISGMVYTSYPEQWDNVYVCDEDKTKQTVRVYGSTPPDYNHIRDYESQDNITSSH